MGDAHASAVDRYEAIDLPFQFLAKEVLHAAEVAKAFFADGGDEGDGAFRLNRCRVQRARHPEQNRQAAAVVADAGPFDDGAALRRLHRCLLRKNGVEMRAQHQVGPR
jgi:hypothetical protein